MNQVRADGDVVGVSLHDDILGFNPLERFCDFE
jgi:hypothetical protein